MAPVGSQVEVVLEVGQTRTFAVAPEWPGWCRIGRDEASALQALIDFGPRYARVLAGTPLSTGDAFPSLTVKTIVWEVLLTPSLTATWNLYVPGP